MRRTIHLLGAGRACCGLARLLRLCGFPIGHVVCRESVHAARAVAAIGAGTPSDDARGAFADHAITLIGVPDSAIEPLAEEVARSLRRPSHSVALHLSGAVPSSALLPLAARGIAIGSLHPLTSFASLDRLPASLESSYFAVEGDREARRAADELVAALKGRAFALAIDRKSLHHAACAVAANALVAVLDLASRLEQSASVPEATARAALLALARSTLLHLDGQPPEAALTGPIERGDVAVLERHLDSVVRHLPDDQRLFRELMRATLRLAQRKGSVDAECAGRLRRILEDGGSDAAPGG